jgi:ubiquinone/menaquinone biosynthesis C-methylase UbiE
MLEQVRRVLLDELRQVERLPEPPSTMTFDQITRFRYPFSRPLQSYLNKLPNLPAYLAPGIRLLDIGTGSGRAAYQLQQQYRCPVYGTGITPIDTVPIPFIVCIAAALPFSDHSFDLAIGVQSLSWEPDQTASLIEISRVLRRGGHAVLIFNPFMYSVDHRFGEEFWEKLGLSKTAYAPLQFTPMLQIPGMSIQTDLVPLQHPYGPYTHSYCVTLTKPL